MRRAIVDTHVILNVEITPGMIPVPGSLIILKQKIPGFNNILAMANYSMSFGLNDDVNKIEKSEPEEVRPSPPKINNDSGNFSRSVLLDEILEQIFNELTRRVMLEPQEEITIQST